MTFSTLMLLATTWNWSLKMKLVKNSQYLAISFYWQVSHHDGYMTVGFMRRRTVCMAIIAIYSAQVMFSMYSDDDHSLKYSL